MIFDIACILIGSLNPTPSILTAALFDLALLLMREFIAPQASSSSAVLPTKEHPKAFFTYLSLPP